MMLNFEDDSLDFTNAAMESFHNTVKNKRFRENSDSELIYEQLEENFRAIPFCDYLKRYIFRKAGLSGNFDDIPLDEYRIIIRESFRDNDTPASFTPTTAKLSALTKNWLTQQSVKRNVVFLLGFGLSMSADDVNDFLVKALHEPQINAKDPFEVLCWYCYTHKYNYAKFERLRKLCMESTATSLDMRLLYSEQTVRVRNVMYSIHDDASLLAYLSKFKTDENTTRFSVTARICFENLYAETRRIVAELYNHEENDRIEKEIKRLRDSFAFNTRMYDCDKNVQIDKIRESRRICSENDITAGDIEQIIYSAVPTDRHGNLTPYKLSRLCEQFSGKRFTRQRIHEILSGSSEIDRFDLITMNFFIYSQKADEITNANKRYHSFVDSTNEILESCSMGQMYIANPYECFLMMCMLSDDPLGTYADVWELSYST